MYFFIKLTIIIYKQIMTIRSILISLKTKDTIINYSKTSYYREIKENIFFIDFEGYKLKIDLIY